MHHRESKQMRQVLWNTSLTEEFPHKLLPPIIFITNVRLTNKRNEIRLSISVCSIMIFIDGHNKQTSESLSSMPMERKTSFKNIHRRLYLFGHTERYRDKSIVGIIPLDPSIKINALLFPTGIHSHYFSCIYSTTYKCKAVFHNLVAIISKQSTHSICNLQLAEDFNQANLINHKSL